MAQIASSIVQAPTLNATRAAAATSASTGDVSTNSSSSGSAASASVEKLLMRWIPRPSVGNVFVGDVVAFNSPLSPPAPDPKVLCLAANRVDSSFAHCLSVSAATAENWRTVASVLEIGQALSCDHLVQQHKA